MNINDAYAHIVRFELLETLAPVVPGSPMAIPDGTGQALSAHAFGGPLAVLYVVEGPEASTYVTEVMRMEAGLSPEALRAVGITNLERRSTGIRFKRTGGRLAATGAGIHTASLLLSTHLWNREDLRNFMPNGPVAAIGARDTLVVCDSGSRSDVAALEEAADVAWSLGSDRDRLTTTLFARAGDATWRPLVKQPPQALAPLDPVAAPPEPTLQQPPIEPEPSATELPQIDDSLLIDLGPIPPSMGLPADEPTLRPVPPITGPEDLPPLDVAAPHFDTTETVQSTAPEQAFYEASDYAQSPETEANPTEDPEPDDPRPTPHPLDVETRRRKRNTAVCYTVLASLSAVLVILGVVAPPEVAVFQVVAFGVAAFAFGANAFESQEHLTHDPMLDGDATPLPTPQGVIAFYALSALAVVSMSAFDWHSIPDRTFSGFERGNGYYTSTFGALLGLGVAIGLTWSDLRRPWDTALHGIAMACGTVFIIVAMAGTAGFGMTAPRLTVLAFGVLTVIVSTWTLRHRHPEVDDRRSVRVGLITGAGFAMTTAPFISWGGGTFLVNYVPGRSIGGVDGTLTMWAGIALVFASLAYFFAFRLDDPKSWRSYIRLVAVLSVIGFVGVLSRGLSVPHPGRTFAALACGAALSLAAGAEPVDVSPQLRNARGRLLTTTVVCILAVISGSLFAAAGNLKPIWNQFRDHDDMLLAALLASIALACALAVRESLRSNSLGLSVATVPFAGLSALMLLPIGGEASAIGMSVGLVFGGFAIACGLAARSEVFLEPLSEQLVDARLIILERWPFILAAGVGAFVYERWIHQLLFTLPTSPDGVPRGEALAALNGYHALTTAIAIGVAAVAVSRLRSLGPTILFATGAALLYSELTTIAYSTLFFADLEFGSNRAVMALLITGYAALFAIGRRPAALLGLMTATIAPLMFFILIVDAVVMWLKSLDNTPTTLIGLLYSSFDLVHYIALAACFAGFPVRRSGDSLARPGEDGDNDGAASDHTQLVGAS